MNADLLCTKEAAALLKVDRKTIRRWRDNPATGFPKPDFVHPASGRPSWWRATLQAWLSRGNQL